MFRIQKLLLSEYQELYEPVIVENPFTQVNANGEGLRQYHIGLTISKLIIGCDDFSLSAANDYFSHDSDPEIETFTLVSLFPLQFVELRFYRRNCRETMQLTVAEDHSNPLYFEIGGHKYRTLFWNTWRERVATIKLTQPLFFNLSDVSSLSSTTLYSAGEEDEEEDDDEIPKGYASGTSSESDSY